MITGLWKHTKLICDCHAQCCPEMEVFDNGRKSYYICPRYYPENRKPLEQPCLNRISVDDFETVLESLSNAIIGAEENDEELYLSNYIFTTRNAKYKISSKGDSDYVISVSAKKLHSAADINAVD